MRCPAPTFLPPAAYLGCRPGSPPGVPGGGMIGILPPPCGGTAIPGSTPAGGQMMPFDAESRSLRSLLPVVSFGVELDVPNPGGHCRSAGAFGGRPCADAAETESIAIAAVNAARVPNLLSLMCVSQHYKANAGRDGIVPHLEGLDPLAGSSWAGTGGFKGGTSPVCRPASCGRRQSGVTRL